MNFPDFVPNNIKTYITSRIEGDEYEPNGLAHTRDNALLELEELKAQIATENKQDDLKLRELVIGKENYYKEINAEIECLQRLGTDKRMALVFEILQSKLFYDAEQIQSFISSAWIAKCKYLVFRDRNQRAVEISKKITKATTKLIELLEDFEKLGVNGPSEFYDISTLLEKTDPAQLENSHHAELDKTYVKQSQNSNSHMWNSFRHTILGKHVNCQSNTEMIAKEEDFILPKFNIRFTNPNEPFSIDPQEELQNAIQYAWKFAPELSVLLKTVSKAAENYNPNKYEKNTIKAALQKRQKNLKTEFLRAFCFKLREGKILSEDPAPALLHSIANISNVIFDSPDLEITYVDVNKTLEIMNF
jgi:hypothetical protein